MSQIDLTSHWAGFTAIAIFAVAYVLVMSEERLRLRKSKPVVVAAGLLWMLIAVVFTGLDRSAEMVEGLRHVHSNTPSCFCSWRSR